jgi:hypothetical protein
MNGHQNKSFLDVKNMVQVRGQYINNIEVKSMDGNRDSGLQQSRSTGNLRSQCGASNSNRQQILSNHDGRR